MTENLTPEQQEQKRREVQEAEQRKQEIINGTQSKKRGDPRVVVSLIMLSAGLLLITLSLFSDSFNMRWLFLLIFIASMAVYLIPVIIAILRRHRNMAAIIILTIFLGWTFLGWVAALVWSTTDNTEK